MTALAAPGAPPRLTIAISTLGTRVRGLVLPPPRAGVVYLVLVQRTEQDVTWLQRADVQVVSLCSLGLSHSRNAALDAVATPYLMFADDDVILDMPGIETVLTAFEADPTLAILTGRLAGRLARRRVSCWASRGASRGASGWIWGRKSRKAGCGAGGHRMHRWNTGRTNSSEIMIRTALIRRAGVRFDISFGLGARHPMGEEYVFLTDALATGLTGRRLPVTMAAHPGRSTGQDWTSPNLWAARVAVLRRVFGPMAPVARLAYGVKHGRALIRTPKLAWRFLVGRPAP